MAAQKFLTTTSGQIQEVQGVITSAGAGSSGALVALDANGKLDISVIPSSVGADTAAIVASEALSAGNYVNIWNNTGTANVRKADASTSGKEAHGYVLAGYSSSASATVYFEGTNSQVSGMTSGVIYLSTTPGTGTSTAPSGSGNVVQKIGYATSATTVNFQSLSPIILV